MARYSRNPPCLYLEKWTLYSHPNRFIIHQICRNMWRIRGIGKNPGPSGKTFGHRRFLEGSPYQKLVSIKGDSKDALPLEERYNRNPDLSLRHKVAMGLSLSCMVLFVSVVMLQMIDKSFQKSLLTSPIYYSPKQESIWFNGEPSDQWQNRIDSLVNDGLNLLSSNEFEASINSFDKAYRMNPYHRPTLFGLTSSLIRSCLYADARCEDAALFFEYIVSLAAAKRLVLTEQEFQAYLKKERNVILPEII